LLVGRVSTRNYLQLATLVAFLVDEHVDWLDKIALGLADGHELSEILDDIGTSFQELQAEWLAWGKRVFAPQSEPPAGPGTHFPVPPHWKKAEEGKDKTDKEKQ
jgi:hypothetical protein